MSEIDKKLDLILNEIEKIKENQKETSVKISKMQKIIDNIAKDIYEDEDFDEDESYDFEIVCPYCENEFVVDVNKNKDEVQCPNCKNTIELDWSGDLEDGEFHCGGYCEGCTGCGTDDEEDDM